MFKSIKEKVLQRFNYLQQHGELFVVDIDRDALVNAYLDTFNNEIERQAHNCNCCKQFLINYGVVVSIIDGKIETLWDFTVGSPYADIPSLLHNLVINSPIKHTFESTFINLGTDYNIQLKENDTIRWEHFSVVLDKSRLTPRGTSIESVIGDKQGNYQVINRGLAQLTIEATETVLDLINQSSLYRGEEHKNTLQAFLAYQKKYSEIQVEHRETYVWSIIKTCPRIRNTAIGTLLIDLSCGVEVDVAVIKFEKLVAPSNYKRTTKLVTQAMYTSAEKELEEKGLTKSIYRRFANKEDIPVNELIFVDRDINEKSLFDGLRDDVPISTKSLSRSEEVSIKDFINHIVPTATKIEVLLERKHKQNMMSLIAPKFDNQPSLFNWDNNLSWSYKDGLADSMKENVKNAGGKVDGALRFSIQWNDEGNNNIDFDAHCYEPNGNHIYYINKGRTHTSTAMLDVDVQNPGGKVAVENIVWTHQNKIQIGDHKLSVKNYDGNTSNAGFTAEIEYNDTIHSYEYDKPLRGGQVIDVAILNNSTEHGLTIKSSLNDSSGSVRSSPLWNLSTNKFYRVSMVMNSPNHWGGNDTGNKHTFFIIDKAINNEPVRGIFNEFLNPDLIGMKRVFEVLGSKVKVESSEEQLSGVGFSSTKRNEVFIKVSGKLTRIIKVKF